MKVGDVVECNRKWISPHGSAPNVAGVVVQKAEDVQEYYLVKFDGLGKGHDGGPRAGKLKLSGKNCWWLYGSSLTLVDEFDGNL